MFGWIRRQRAVVRIFPFLAILAAALAPAAEAGLAIRQRSNGVPGAARDRVVEQQLLIGDGKIRVDDLSRKDGRYVIVRLDREVFWEVDPKLEAYTETRFAYYRERRADAEREREEDRQALLRKHEKGRITDAELAAALARKGMRRDGKRVIEVKRDPAISRDGARVERVAIELNGVTQVAVWQTDRYAGEYETPKELLQVYEKCGFFPDDVTEALRRHVTLFPERIYANIDLHTVGGELESRVEAVSAWTEDPARFEIPSGFRLVPEFPKGEVARREYACPACGAKVDPLTAPFAARDPATNQKHYFDSEAHWSEYVIQKGWKP